MHNYTIEIRSINVSEYQNLRATTTWEPIEDNVVEKALEQDLFSVCIVHEKKVIGMGRVIGDGAMYFYIQDVIVSPEYQGKGVGNIIMEHIEQFLKEKTNNHSFIGLMAASGVRHFYKKFGYMERPKDRPGMYKMIKK